MLYNMATVNNICDDKGQVIFESLTAHEFDTWYWDQVESGFDFTGWTAEDMDLNEFVADEFEIFA